MYTTWPCQKAIPRVYMVYKLDLHAWSCWDRSLIHISIPVVFIYSNLHGGSCWYYKVNPAWADVAALGLGSICGRESERHGVATAADAPIPTTGGLTSASATGLDAALCSMIVRSLGGLGIWGLATGGRGWSGSCFSNSPISSLNRSGSWVSCTGPRESANRGKPSATGSESVGWESDDSSPEARALKGHQSWQANGFGQLAPPILVFW